MRTNERKRPEDAPQPWGYFAGWVRSGLLTGAAILALAALVSDMDPGTTDTYAAVPWLATRLHLSQSAMRRRLGALKDKKVVKQTQTGTRYRASGWRILPPPEEV